MLTQRGASSLLGIVLFSTLSWLSGIPWFIVASLVLVLLFLLENVRFVRSLRAIQRLKVERTVSDTRLFVGSPTRVGLRIENVVGRGTGYLFIHDMVPATFRVQSGSPRAIMRIRPRAIVNLNYTLEGRQIGDQKIEGVRIVAQDSLGFSRYTLTVPVKSEFQVYPRIRPLSLLRARGIAQVRPATSIGERAITRSGLGSDFRGIREYNPGDEFKHIAWKVVAKSARRSLMTKEFEADRSLNVVVAIQATNAMLDGKVGSRKLDYAVEALVALAYACAHEGDRLLLVFDGGAQMLTVPGQGRQRQIVRAIQLTYNLNPMRQETLPELASSVRQHVKLKSLVFVIADPELESSSQVDSIATLTGIGHQPFVYFLETASFFDKPVTSDSRTRMGWDVLQSTVRRTRDRLQQVASKSSLNVKFCSANDLFPTIFQTYLSAKKRGVITV